MMRAWTVGLLLLAASGCRETNAASAPPSADLPEGSVRAPEFTREGEPEAPSAEALPAAEPEEGLSEKAPGEEAPGEEEPAKETAEEGSAGDEPLPNVEVRNVGMHIGGADNTLAQKRPIRAEVAKHYDAMRRCYARADAPGKTATFGVDMRIAGDGGPAKITNPRSGLKGEGVKECLVEVFEAIEFPRQPKGQPQMVSFSIEFRRN